MTLTELFNIDWRETSFVPAGDNPPARLVMWKNAPTLTDEELEEVLSEAASEAPEAGEGPLSKFRTRLAALVPGFGKHLAGTKYDHDQSTHGGGSKGSGSSGSKDPNPTREGKYAPDKETRQKQTDKMRKTLENRIGKVKGLDGHRDELIRAARFLAYEDDDWANDFFAEIPTRLKGEAKNAVAKALEGIGIKVEYTKYEDGSKAPTGIKSRPDSMKGADFYSSPGDASGRVKYPKKTEKATPDGVPTFDDNLRTRMSEQIHKELFTYMGALEEALSTALYGPPISGDDPAGSNALSQSVDEFAAAIKEAIPLWASGKTSLSKEEQTTDGGNPAPTRKEGPVPISDEQRNALPEEVRGYLTELEARPAPTGTETTDDAAEDPVQKMLKEQDIPEDSPLGKMLKAQNDTIQNQGTTIEKMVEDGAMERLEKRARAAGAEDPKGFAKTLRTIEKSVGADEAEKVAKQLEAANAKAGATITDLTKLRQDPASFAGTAEDTALGKANKLAKAKVDAEPQRFGKMDPAAAMASARREVWGERPDLAEEHRQESA